MTEQPTIIYTLTDEAPLLATYAFLPVIRTFADAAGIDVKTSDISVAARILAEFSDYLTEEQQVPDNLAALGKLTQLPETNIIKLPNISASVPQLHAAIKELKARGTTFRTKFDLVEAMGAEYYVHFGVKADTLESSHVDDLLADQGGVSETTAEGEAVVVARLDAESKVSVGEPTEVWLDATKMHFFDADSGLALAS